MDNNIKGTMNASLFWPRGIHSDRARLQFIYIRFYREYMVGKYVYVMAVKIEISKFLLFMDTEINVTPIDSYIRNCAKPRNWEFSIFLLETWAAILDLVHKC